MNKKSIFFIKSGPPGESRGGESSSSIVPGAVVVLSRASLLKLSELSPVGTISFVKDEESLFVRVSEGWRPILVRFKFISLDGSVKNI